MAKETKLLRKAREDAEQARMQAEMESTYVSRLMNALEEAQTFGNYELTVKNQMLVLHDRNDDYAGDKSFALTYDDDSDLNLNSLLWDLKDAKEEREEAARKEALRLTALNKLSLEEQEALGLVKMSKW